MKLTLEQTKIIKGIAILMMVFLHLFNHIADVEQCTYFLTVGNLPFVHWLTRAANPVPFYLFLSGYGLYYTWSSDKILKPWTRCVKLYQVYWVSLLVMVGIGCLVKPALYPGSIIKIVENATGWNTSYNAEAWFLFPYILLVLSSKWLFPWVRKMRGIIIAGIGFTLYIATAFIISKASRSGNEWLFTTMWAYHPILYFECLCSFLFGAIACKHSREDLPAWFIQLTNHGWQVVLLLLILIIARCIVNTDACSPIYAFSIIILLSRIQWSKQLNKLLVFFGKHSTTMWLTHSYFCYYLFRDFIYGFKYPLSIYIITIGCALCASYMIEFLVSRVQKQIKHKINTSSI